MSTREHEYAARVTWEGNTGEGTAAYDRYARRFRVRVAGKPDLAGSASAMFRGEPELHDPEDLFLAAVSSCHMLAYLALCARSGVRVLAYEDDARGTLALDPAGGGRFTEITLRPRVTIADAAHVRLAERLHATAHARCFIAGSVSVAIRHEAVIVVEGGGGRVSLSSRGSGAQHRDRGICL